MWQLYLNALRQQPLLTKATTTGIAFLTTDAIAQSYEPREDGGSYDLERAARSALYGAVFLGPSNHVLWGARFGLERHFPGASWKAVFQRVAFDQAFIMRTTAHGTNHRDNDAFFDACSMRSSRKHAFRL